MKTWLAGLTFFSGLLMGASDLYAAPLLVDLGPDKIVTGVTRTSDGTSYLVGHQLNAQSGQQEAIVVTIPAGGTTFSVGVLPSIGADDTIATKISPNGAFITGYYSPNLGGDRGLFWNAAANDVTDIGSLLDGFDTQGLAVSNTATVAGFTAGGSIPILWNSSTGLTQLQTTGFLSGSASGISSDGTVAAGELVTLSGDSIVATVWTNGALSTLENSSTSAGTIVGWVRDVSADGSTFGGFVNFFDSSLEADLGQAAVWSGPSSAITLLSNVDGSPFVGEVLGVSDNGYAVGSSPAGGFIWQAGWASPVLFNNWVDSEFGISIPTWVTAVHDIFFDGVGLVFALQGSAYYFTTEASASGGSEVPEPGTLLLLFGAVPLMMRGMKSRAISSS